MKLNLFLGCQIHLFTFMHQITSKVNSISFSCAKKKRAKKHAILTLFRLSEIDIYQLDKLQHLDISRNCISSFQDMSQLKSLRVLDASHNAITTCKPFQNLSGLVSLSLKANSIRRLINFESMPR